jgi:hypothetical protein
MFSSYECSRARSQPDALPLQPNVTGPPYVPMNDNEATIPQQIAHLEAMAGTMHEDLEEARAGLLAKPGDERLAKQVAALEGLLKRVVKKVERLRRRDT